MRVQGMAGEMPVLPLDVPLSHCVLLFCKGSAGCSGRGGFQAAVAPTGIREDDPYGPVKDWSILLARLRTVCSGAPLARTARTLADPYRALYEGAGYA